MSLRFQTDLTRSPKASSEKCVSTKLRPSPRTRVPRPPGPRSLHLERGNPLDMRVRVALFSRSNSYPRQTREGDRYRGRENPTTRTSTTPELVLILGRARPRVRRVRACVGIVRLRVRACEREYFGPYDWADNYFLQGRRDSTETSVRLSASNMRHN